MSQTGQQVVTPDSIWTEAGNALLSGIGTSGPAVVLKLSLLGASLGGAELDNFNTAITLFDQKLQATGDWSGSFDAAFGSNSVFQAMAKSEALAAAIQAAGQVIGFIQGLVNVVKSIL